MILFSGPIINREALFVIGFQGNVAAFDLDSGQQLWSKEASSYRNLASGYGSLYFVSEDDLLSAVEQRTGNILWQQDLFQRRHLITPHTWKNFVLVTDDEGQMYVSAQVNGEYLGN